MAQMLEKRAQTITDGIWAHGVVNHKKFGRVFAYEVDGYGSQILMDDANVPSLLALPIMGFVEKTDPVYVATRKMLLRKDGNPYYLEGQAFHGIGGNLLLEHRSNRSVT
jgi:meiotically up-regulated gene 157 (Mug157) protein